MHCITIYLGKKSEIRDLEIRYLEMPQGIVAFLDYTEELPINRTVAVISTDYFGGFGDQSATLLVNQNVEYEGDTAQGDRSPINEALKRMGVFSENDDDEFDTIGLGKYRSNQDFEEEWNSLFNPQDL